MLKIAGGVCLGLVMFVFLVGVVAYVVTNNAPAESGYTVPDVSTPYYESAECDGANPDNTNDGC